MIRMTQDFAARSCFARQASLRSRMNLNTAPSRRSALRSRFSSFVAVIGSRRSPSKLGLMQRDYQMCQTPSWSLPISQSRPWSGGPEGAITQTNSPWLLWVRSGQSALVSLMTAMRQKRTFVAIPGLSYLPKGSSDTKNPIPFFPKDPSGALTTLPPPPASEIKRGGAG